MKKDNKQKKQTLRQKFEKCEKEKQEFLEGWQRVKADFLNYKKQEGERIDKIGQFAREEMILEMLSIHDDLERAREHMPENLKDVDWVKGVLQIEGRFHSFFKEQGVERIDPQGEQFDPSLHEAVGEQEEKNKNTGTIIKVVQKGYKLNGRVLRPAKVKIAR
jgi:molecular chaperone GrpE